MGGSNKKALFSVAFIVLMFSALGAINYFGFIFNITESIPIGLYRRVDLQIEKNNYVAYCLTDKDSLYALERGYVSSGICPNKTSYMLKEVIGEPGDEIIISENGVFVNQEFIANSFPKRFDSKGKDMPAVVVKKKLSENEFLLMSNHESGFDGRYLGVTDRNQIVSVIRNVFVF